MATLIQGLRLTQAQEQVIEALKQEFPTQPARDERVRKALPFSIRNLFPAMINEEFVTQIVRINAWALLFFDEKYHTLYHIRIANQQDPAILKALSSEIQPLCIRVINAENRLAQAQAASRYQEASPQVESQEANLELAAALSDLDKALTVDALYRRRNQVEKTIQIMKTRATELDETYTKFEILEKNFSENAQLGLFAIELNRAYLETMQALDSFNKVLQELSDVRNALQKTERKLTEVLSAQAQTQALPLFLPVDIESLGPVTGEDDLNVCRDIPVKSATENNPLEFPLFTPMVEETQICEEYTSPS